MRQIKTQECGAPLVRRAGGCLILMLLVFNLVDPTAAGAEETRSANVLNAWVTPKRFKHLAPHPRLFVTEQDIKRMVVKGKGDEYKDAYETVKAAAETGLKDLENPMAGISRWSRAVLIQGRLTALAIQWHRTGDRRYLEGALKTIDAMRAWMPPHSITLAEGQFIAGVAVTYDLLYNDLTPEQRAWMVKIAHESFAKPFLRVTGPRDPKQRIAGEGREWWMGIISNWNPVSISGGGLLALAMYEDLPEAQTMIDRVNASYQPIFDYLKTTEGGWVEGLGYWNWTMHYMSLFLISYERATGQKHAGFHSEGFHQTLIFGTYFVPHGEPCGFGDNQHGEFSASLYAAARHLGYDDALRRLQDHKLRMKTAAEIQAARRAAAGTKTEKKVPAPPPAGDAPVNISYGLPQNLLIEPAPLAKGLKPRKNRVKQYPIQGWGMLADQWPNPTIYASVRGGVLGGAHSYNDLLSWNAVVGIEKMMTSISGGRSSSAAFGARDKEIYERGSTSKNTLFIGGLPPSRTKSGRVQATTTAFQLPTGPVLRLDASRAFWLGSGNPKFVCRLFAIIDDKGLLVLDRVLGRSSNPVEARAFTEKEATFGDQDVLIKGEFETARMTFAADQPAGLLRSRAILTSYHANPPVMIRWQTLKKVKNVTLASFLSKGEAPVDLDVTSAKSGVTVSITASGWRKTIRLSDRLEPME